MLFQDRQDAGRILATLLHSFAGRHDVQVLALPRGGVPVAAEVAQALALPMHVFLVRKLGAPGQEELAMGAIASGGVRVLNAEVVNALGVSPEEIDRATAKELAELERREREYGVHKPVPVGGQTVLLIDDGLATGATMRAAVAALRQMHPAKIVVAVPVASETACEDLRAEADEVVCAATPAGFEAVGQFYRNFTQVSDDEVRELLTKR